MTPEITGPARAAWARLPERMFNRVDDVVTAFIEDGEQAWLHLNVVAMFRVSTVAVTVIEAGEVLILVERTTMRILAVGHL